MPDAPLIITLQLDETSFRFFNDLRRQYFPPAINYLDAHLTLFHHLPSGERSLLNDLEEWSRQQPVLPLSVTEVKSMGKGVAYRMEAPPLLALHRQMQQAWKAWLTPQDSQKLWPHVTVQNKVTPEKARETVQRLQASFQPFTAKGLGFGLWWYRGGPWEFVRTYPFGR